MDELDEYWSAAQLEKMTGTPASTWRYWAHANRPPASVKIGRRRVWRKSVILKFLASLDEPSPRD